MSPDITTIRLKTLWTEKPQSLSFIKKAHPDLVFSRADLFSRRATTLAPRLLIAVYYGAWLDSSAVANEVRFQFDQFHRPSWGIALTGTVVGRKWWTT